MTRAEAQERSEKLNRDRPDGEAPWIVREASPGDWQLVRPRVPGLPVREPLKATTEAKPKPPQADDPRPPFPPYVGPAG